MKKNRGGADELSIEVICRRLPGIRFADYEPVFLGIQKGDEVIEAVPGNRKEAFFRAIFKIDERPDGSPNFLGPFAKGTPQERFFYLSWGVMLKDGRFEMFRRAKIHLSHLTWTQIRTSLARRRPLKVIIEMTDDKGCPVCASIREDRADWRI